MEHVYVDRAENTIVQSTEASNLPLKVVDADDFLRVHEVFRVERLLHCLHHINSRFAELRHQVLPLFDTDSVLSCARAIHTDGSLDYGHVESVCLFIFDWVGRVEHDEHLKANIAHMADNRAIQEARVEFFLMQSVSLEIGTATSVAMTCLSSMNVYALAAVSPTGRSPTHVSCKNPRASA